MSIEIKGNIYGMGCYSFKDNTGKVLYIGSGMMNDRLQNHEYYLKRGLYENTNKKVLQQEFEKDNLIFEVLHFSENNSEYLNGTDSERMAIQEALEVLEQFYYNMYKDTCCNKIKRIRKTSSSPNKMTTYKRKQANMGSNNPNCYVLTEETASEILWLKQNTKMKNKEIADIYKCRANLISRVGKDRWLSVNKIKPSWYEEEN